MENSLLMKSIKLKNMTQQEIIGQLCTVFEPWVSDIDLTSKIKEDTNLITDLGLDSIGVLNVILDIEKAFGISIQTHELDSELLSRLGNLVRMIEEKIHEIN